MKYVAETLEDLRHDVAEAYHDDVDPLDAVEEVLFDLDPRDLLLVFAAMDERDLDRLFYHTAAYEVMRENLADLLLRDYT